MRYSSHYYGWNIVLAATVISLLTSGMRMGAGPFFLPMLSELGYSRSMLSSVMAIGMLAYGAGMPLAGYLVNRYQTKWVLLSGATLVLVAAAWSIYAHDIYQFSIAYGILLSIGLAFLSPVTFSAVISHWFVRQRAKALFFLSTGGMAGIAIMTTLFSYTISWFGWQATLFGFSLLFFILTVPVALYVIKEEAPAQADNRPDLSQHAAREKVTSPTLTFTFWQALLTRPFWFICLGLFACGFSMNLLGTHGVTMLIDHGFTPDASAYGISLIGLVAIAGTLLLGRIADRVAQKYLLALIYFIRGLGFIGLVLATHLWQLFTIATIGGLVWAGSIALSTVILANHYGRRLVGLLFGWAFLIHQIGGMISSILAGWAYQHYQTHLIAFGSAGGLLLFAALICLGIPRK